MGFIERENKIYAKILSDGTLRIPTMENDPEAVKRVVDMTDGSKKTFIEQVKQGIQGKIESIYFKEMDFGKMINLVFALEAGERDQIVLSMNCTSNFATDIMEKLPNLDINREISLSPWAMTKDNGKTSKGVAVWQTPEGAEEGTAKAKVTSFFKEYKEGEKRPTIKNGFPTPKGEGKGFDKDDWKMYFTEVKKFLVKHTEDNIIPNLEFDVEKAVPAEGEEKKEEKDVDQIPL